LQLQGRLSDEQGIYGQLLLLAVQFDLKPLFQKGLEHLRYLFRSRARRQLGVHIEPRQNADGKLKSWRPADNPGL
jgi:hypothetical protein